MSEKARTSPFRGEGGEGPESALCSWWLTTRRMGEDAPKGTVRRN